LIENKAAGTPPLLFEALAHTLDEDADFVVHRMGEQGSVPAAFLVYRHDQDLPPSRGLRTVGYHLALARRVGERRPDIDGHRPTVTSVLV
jgi:hypothetical protein